MSYYYISYKQSVPWNGTVFNANEYRKKINEFYSKIDLVNPNLKTDKSTSLVFDVPVKDLSPNVLVQNEWTFDLAGYFLTTKDTVNGLYRSFLTLGGDVKIPRLSESGKNLRQIIASSNKSVESFGKTPEQAVFNAYKELRESLLQTLSDQISGSGKGIKVERQDPFTDPEPALTGPPTQNISGVTYKAPVVDNPNVKLPSQEVKSLTATSATDAIQQAKPNVQVGSSISQVQDMKSDTVSSITDKVNPKRIKPDGLGKDWSPDKFSPESIAGNDKFVDPRTGQIGSTSTLAKTLGVTALGGGIGAGIGAIVGGGQGALIGGLSGGAIGVASAKLKSVQQGIPKPNIPKPPNTPRIKTVKIPRPDSTKGAETLLNLQKSPSNL